MFFWKKKPGPDTVSIAEYNRMEDALNARIQACHTAIADMRQERDLARAQAASNAVDAHKYRERCRRDRENMAAKRKARAA